MGIFPIKIMGNTLQISHVQFCSYRMRLVNYILSVTGLVSLVLASPGSEKNTRGGGPIVDLGYAVHRAAINVCLSLKLPFGVLGQEILIRHRKPGNTTPFLILDMLLHH